MPQARASDSSRLTLQPRPLVRAMALALASMSAWAQQGAATAPAGAASAPEAARRGDAQSTQTIVVTAGKREQSLREVPSSVSAESGASLEARGARDAEDLVKTLPGIILNKGTNAEKSMLTIRGISTVTGNNIIQSTAGLYVEDVPFNDVIFPASNPDVAPFDLDRIEVLKGPQGVLYGSMSLGGALRYLYNKPSLANIEGSVLLNVESMSHGGSGHSAYAMVNVPVIKDTLALRAVAFKRHDAGFTDKPAAGLKDVNEVDQDGGRLMALWKLSPNWRALVMYQEQTTDQPDSASLNDAAVSAHKLESTATLIAPSRSKWRFGNVQLDGDLGAGLKISANAGWLKKDFALRNDNTIALGGFPTLLGLGLPRFSQVLGFIPATTDMSSQEVRLSSSGKPLTWLVGVFNQKIDFVTSSIQSVPGGPGTTYLPVARFLFTQSSPGVFTDRIVDFSTYGQTKETAVFADGEYDLGSGWSAAFGARHSTTKQDYIVNSNTPLAGAPTLSPQTANQSTTTPKASIKRKLEGDGLWYASVSKGFRFGGIPAGNPPTPVKSDAVLNYETGLRLAPMRDLTVDLTAFTIDWSDAQIIVLDTAGASSIRNAGKVRINGAEAAVKLRTGAFNWEAALSYTDGKTREPFASLYTFNTNNALSFTPAGARLPGTPRVQGSASGTYRFEGPFGSSGRATAIVAYQGERAGNTLALPVTLPAFTTVDLRLALGRGPVEVTVFVNNAADKLGLVSAAKSSAAAPATYVPIRPRTIGTALRVDF